MWKDILKEEDLYNEKVKPLMEAAIKEMNPDEWHTWEGMGVTNYIVRFNYYMPISNFRSYNQNIKIEFSFDLENTEMTMKWTRERPPVASYLRVITLDSMDKLLTMENIMREIKTFEEFHDLKEYLEDLEARNRG